MMDAAMVCLSTPRDGYTLRMDDLHDGRDAIASPWSTREGP